MCHKFNNLWTHFSGRTEIHCLRGWMSEGPSFPQRSRFGGERVYAEGSVWNL